MGQKSSGTPMGSSPSSMNPGQAAGSRRSSRPAPDGWEAGHRADYILETPSSATICALALSGDAVGFVNPISAEGYSERGLVLRSFAPKATFRSLLVFRPDTQRAGLVRDFTAILFRLRNQLQLPR